MRAQPDLWSFLNLKKNKKFKVQVSKKTGLEDHIRLDELPEKVLFGWFAHELGHVYDYHKRGFFEMIWFGIRYMISESYQRKVEFRADLFAIQFGMAEEIVATKKYILNHSSLPEHYKERIRKYYMSLSEVEAIIKQNEEEELLADDANILKP